MQNKKVFSFRQNDVSDTQSVMSCGRLFQSVGPVLRNQMTPLIIDCRVVLFRNILTPVILLGLGLGLGLGGQFISGGQNIS